MVTTAGVPPQTKPPGTAPTAQPPLSPPASASPAVATTKPSLQDLLEKYVKVTKSLNTSAMLPYEGVCQRPTCGWHTMQLSREAAETLLRSHVQQHWRDVSNQL